MQLIYFCLWVTLSRSNPETRKLIEKLNLRPHPLENGFFSDNTYESARKMKIGNNDLLLSDVVYWLYEEGDFAPWHRMLYSDEFWIHQSGGSLEVRGSETLSHYAKTVRNVQYIAEWATVNLCEKTMCHYVRGCESNATKLPVCRRILCLGSYYQHRQQKLCQKVTSTVRHRAHTERLMVCSQSCHRCRIYFVFSYALSRYISCDLGMIFFIEA